MTDSVTPLNPRAPRLRDTPQDSQTTEPNPEPKRAPEQRSASELPASETPPWLSSRK